MTQQELVSLAVAALTTAAGTWAYRHFAARRGIVATANSRSLHERPVPRGGGIVFSIVAVAVVAAMSTSAAVDPALARTLITGGLIAAIFGWLDDVHQVRALVKLGVQCALAAWMLWSLGGLPIYDVPGTPPWLDLGFSWLGLVWLLNAYNFIDGIDGLAASGAATISALAILATTLAGTDAGVLFACATLAVCSLAFLGYNWPRASVFMGDAGSLFLGFAVATLLVFTVSRGLIGFWTWIVILAFLGGDTTTTTLLRIFLTKRWYGEHRSHAYQNLARLHSHLKVLQGILAYHLVWLLPLTIWSVSMPAMAPVAALLAVAPVVTWTFRYGPRLSSA